MDSAPLPTVSSPLDLLGKVGIVIPGHQSILMVLAGAVLLWTLFTVVAMYHWIRYSHNSWVAVPAIVAHLVVSGTLIVFASSGLL